jgi:TPR repeat protein
MKHLTLTICLTLSVLLGSLVTGCGSDSDSGADFDKGVAAYESGDYATALRELRPLAEQGHANAQFHMGVTYAEGVGVPKDYKTAMKWFTLAAEQGNASAQVSLGFMYRKGRGVPQDDKTAAKWYTLAVEQWKPLAEQGNADAQYGLGVM